MVSQQELDEASKEGRRLHKALQQAKDALRRFDQTYPARMLKAQSIGNGHHSEEFLKADWDPVFLGLLGACPECGAPEGDMCLTYNGWQTEPHYRRYPKDAQRAHLAQMKAEREATPEWQAHEAERRAVEEWIEAKRREVLGPFEA